MRIHGLPEVLVSAVWAASKVRVELSLPPDWSCTCIKSRVNGLNKPYSPLSESLVTALNSDIARRLITITRIIAVKVLTLGRFTLSVTFSNITSYLSFLSIS